MKPRHAITCVALFMSAAVLSAATPTVDKSGIAELNQTREQLEDYGQNDKDESKIDQKSNSSKLAVPTPQQLAFMDLEIGGIRTQGHNSKHARHGIRLRHGAESVVLSAISPVNDEEPFWLIVN